SIQLCEWVLARSWHIHNSWLILRRWTKGISLVSFSPKATPKWIMFKKVPPVILNNEGISWIASKIGKPINKFVRDETNVRVCLLRDRSTLCPESINVELEDDDMACIKILRFHAREYRKDTSKQVWMAKESKDVSGTAVAEDHSASPSRLRMFLKVWVRL
ncbi:hypothetical protein LINPERPRIM_LOCUS20322, partial [Linum perenne]